MMTKDEFERLLSRERGYVVYMAGRRDDEPNVPNEGNPYEYGTAAWESWRIGQSQAATEVQDS